VSGRPGTNLFVQAWGSVALSFQKSRHRKCHIICYMYKAGGRQCKTTMRPSPVQASGSLAWFSSRDSFCLEILCDHILGENGVRLSLVHPLFHTKLG
jgi:hypothetical protein